MRYARRGMTLIEIVIAMAIFLAVMVVVMEGLTSTQRFAATSEAQDDLNTEALRVLDEISLDLTCSGWCLPCASGTTTPVSPTGTSFTDPNDDRKIRYYPFIEMQATGSGMTTEQGQQFAHTWRSGAIAGPVIPASVAPFLPGSTADRTAYFGLSNRAAYDASFFARSQEPIFLKATISDWDHANDQPLQHSDGRPSLYFGGSRTDWASQSTDTATEEAKRKRIRVLYASGWAPVYNAGGDITGYTERNVYGYSSGSSGTVIGTALNVPYGVVMESGYMTDPANDPGAIDVNWRTQSGVGGYTVAEQSLGDLMEYMYAVVPTRFGLGRLVRAHSVAMASATIPDYPDVGSPISFANGRAMVVERVLSDNVVRIVADTWRTVDQVSPVPDPYEVKQLDVNLIRVRLYLARQAKGGGVLSLTHDRVITMRARNSDKDKDFDEAGSSAALLGRKPIGINF